MAHKVGDTVTVTRGPHKGAPHKVIHVHKDGSVNVKPHKMMPNQIKYRLGAAKAKSSEVRKMNEDKDHVSSNYAMHSHSNEAEKKAHAAHMKKKHGVKTTYHGDDEVRYHGSKKNVKKALGNHYGGDHDHAKEEHPHIYKEDTKWPIYQRIMEKNVVNQNAVPPQPMIPAEKQLKDHEGETVNQSQDHISAAAAQWIKDHEGNQVPDDAVDHEKVVAKNKADQMRTVPNQAKDEVNKKAAKAETMKKVEEK